MSEKVDPCIDSSEMSKEVEGGSPLEPKTTEVEGYIYDVVEITDAEDADEAFGFLDNHPHAAELLEEGRAILEDPQRARQLLRKIDLTIVPLLAGIYFLQYLDKTAVAYTAVMGMIQDTHLVGQQYSIISLLFYVGFLVFEFPTQYLAQHISRLGLYVGINLVLWGIVLTCHAACQNFIQLAVLRTLLGIFESCASPILILIIAMWYKKHEQGRRISWYYVCNSLGIVIGGCVAYGVSFVKSTFAVWRIFFLVIGLITVTFGIIVCLFLPDSPVKAKRFTEAEKVALLLRVKENQSGTQNSKIKKEQVLETFKDVRVWLIVICTLLCSIPNGGLTTYSTILLTTFGYTYQQALILSAAAGAVAVVFVLLSGYLSDRWHDRSTIMMICIIPTILSAGLTIGLDPDGVPINKAGLLAAACLAGTFGASFMLLLAWNASNIAGHSKKVTTNALTLTAFCIGNIVGTQTFRAKEAPGYVSGKISICVTLGALCFMILVLRLYNDWLNKQNRKVLAGMSEDQKQELRDRLAFADQTDRQNPFFVYTH